MNHHVMKSALGALVIAALGASAPATLAATELETFQKRIGKSAPADPFIKPKGTCVCREAFVSALIGRAGVLDQSLDANGRVIVVCVIPQFNTTTGEQIGFGTCDGIFVALPK